VVLRPLGHTVSQDDYTNIIGHSVEAAWDWVIGHFGLVEPRDEFVRQYDTAVLQMLKAPVEPLPGVRELIAELNRRRIPVGLASASLRQWVDATIRGLGLEDAFGVTVSASEVEHAKPAPDLYLKAAAGLGVPPEQCVAVEDTGAGLASAKAAGMFGIQTRASSTALPPLQAADLVIEAYSEFDFGLFAGIGK
jgi:HAD superfamily hydrolase (TIGR01509 family)